MAPSRIELMEEIFTPVQKREIISKLADAFILINGKKMKLFCIAEVATAAGRQL